MPATNTPGDIGNALTAGSRRRHAAVT